MQSVQVLENKIKDYAQKYYEGNPEISDNEFDSLVEQLRSINPDSQYLKETGWGYNPLNSPLEKVDHEYSAMTGIPRKLRPVDYRDKVFNDVTLSTKLDGASVGIYYKDGKFEYALSRGNGTTGLDISDKIKEMVPLTLNSKFTGRVRGELVLPRETFDSKYKKDGFKSPRNLSSGLINTKDYSRDDLKDFLVICYTVTDSNGKDRSMEDSQEFLRDNEFITVNSTTVKRDNLNDNSLEMALNTLCIYNGMHVDCDGFVGEDSNGKLAIKWNTESAMATVKNITWHMSRHGKLTPVINIDSVELKDAMISNISGFNARYIRANSIGKGTELEIVRSGDIIPYVKNVVKSTEALIPTHCPYCGQELVDDGTDIVCKNPDCDAMSVNKLKNFIANVAPVNGIGTTLLDKYFDYFNITNICSLSDSINSNTHNLEEFKKNTNGIGSYNIACLTDMESTLKKPIHVDKFVCGLGIKGIASRFSIKLFIEDRMTVDDFLTYVKEERDIDGLNITGNSSLKINKNFILDAFSKYNVVDVPSHAKSNTLEKDRNKIGVCITGKLSVPRKDLLREFEKYGVVEVPIKQAQYLITDNPTGNSTKNKLATQYNVEKISESDFRNLLLNSEKEDSFIDIDVNNVDELDSLYRLIDIDDVTRNKDGSHMRFLIISHYRELGTAEFDYENKDRYIFKEFEGKSVTDENILLEIEDFLKRAYVYDKENQVKKAV